MKERGEKRVRRKRPVAMPPDHKLIFLEKGENVIAICANPSCASLIFKGTDKTQMGYHILKNRCENHIKFFLELSGTNHEIDIIYPHSGRILDSTDLSYVEFPEIIRPKGN